MTEYGLTSEGFVPKTLEVIKAELEDAFRTEFDQNIRLDPKSVGGQLVGIFSEREALLWDLAEKVYGSAFPLLAEGSSLDDLAALAAVQRDPATYSAVTLALSGTPSTLIPEGSVVADPALDIEWITAAPVTLDGSGEGSVEASPGVTGPIVGLENTITEIRSPVGGWAGVTNPEDAELGSDVQNDAGLLAKHRDAFRAGAGGVEALRAALLRVSGVLEVLVIESPDVEPDTDGRPGKSFEAVVRGGELQDIADTIWRIKDAGIKTYGSVTNTVIDSAGDGHTIYFSRPTEVPIYFVVDLEVQPGFPSNGEQLIKTTMAEFGQAFTIGKDVVPFHFMQRIELENIESLVIKAGRAANPSSTGTVVIKRTELATISSANITINRIN